MSKRVINTVNGRVAIVLEENINGARSIIQYEDEKDNTYAVLNVFLEDVIVEKR